VDSAQRAHFETFGFVVVPDCFDVNALAAELDRSMFEAFHGRSDANTGPVDNRFRYVPLMVGRTPISMELTNRFAHTAVELLRAPILPGRTKGTEYHGATDWHRDSDGPLRSIGFVCYLDALDGDTGALQVVPGSHHGEFAASILAYIDEQRPVPAAALGTSPGDAIVFDERLFHASAGGETRRQWRVDFVAAAEPGHEELTRYFARQYRVGWDGGYDGDRFPSYGPEWRERNPVWAQQLRDLGVLDLVAAEEAFMRQNRPDQSPDPGVTRRVAHR
jgi:Phytanoyl-CoA dioxygenase (PhyH)